MAVFSKVIAKASRFSNLSWRIVEFTKAYVQQAPLKAAQSTCCRQLGRGTFMLCSVAVTMKSPTSITPVQKVSSASTPIKVAGQTSRMIVAFQMAVFQFIVAIYRLFKFVFLFTPLILTAPMLYMGDKSRSMWYSLAVIIFEHAGAATVKLGQWASTRPDLFSPEFCNAFSKLQRHVKPHPFLFTKYKLKKRFGKHWKKVIRKLEKKPLGSGCVAQVHKAYLDLSNLPDEVADEIREEFPENCEEENSWDDAFEVLGFHHSEEEEELAEEYPIYDEGPQGNNIKYKRTNTQCGSKTQTKITDDLVPIALKVLHPGVRQQIKSDLEVLNMLAYIGETLIPPLQYLNIVDCVKEFSASMREQIDLRIEADNYTKFIELFSDDPDIRFPRPIRPFVWRDLCTLSYEEGRPISHFLPGHKSQDTYIAQIDESDTMDQTSDITQDDSVRERLADMGLNALLKMIFHYNFVHTDLHPGNIAVQVAGPVDKNEKVELVNLFDTVMITVKPRENPLTLVLYDCGLATSLPPEKKDSMGQVFSAIVRGDGRRVGELFLEHSKISKNTDKEAFVEDLATLISAATKDTLTLANVEVGPLIGEFFSILSRHQVKLDSNFVNVMMAVIVVEGLGRSLNPSIDILGLVAKYVLTYR